MGGPAIAILERNRVAGSRIGRIAAAAADLAPVVLAASPEQLGAELSEAPVVLACDLADLVEVRRVLAQFGSVRTVVWSADRSAALRAAEADPGLRNVVGWPSFASIPRGTELGLVFRRLLTPDLPLPPASQWFTWGAHRAIYRVDSTAVRDELVSHVVEWTRNAGVAERSALRAGEVAHELLTNALYTAPVDKGGRPRYAHDRAAPVSLAADEAPTLEIVFDGQLLVLEVADRFGRLREEQVLASLLRSVENQSGGDGPLLDIANGGAGIGLGLVHASSVAVIAEISPGRSTRVAWTHDVDLHPRDYRMLPGSLHLFRTSLGEGA